MSGAQPGAAVVVVGAGDGDGVVTGAGVVVVGAGAGGTYDGIGSTGGPGSTGAGAAGAGTGATGSVVPGSAPTVGSAGAGSGVLGSAVLGSAVLGSGVDGATGTGVVTGAVVVGGEAGPVVGSALGAVAALLGATPVLTAAGVLRPGPLTASVTAAETSAAATTARVPMAILTGRVRVEESVVRHGLPAPGPGRPLTACRAPRRSSSPTTPLPRSHRRPGQGRTTRARVHPVG